MPIEAALIKPVVDALMALFRESNDLKLKRNAEGALREAIRELLLANPDENKAQARIAIAKAAGILSEDVVLAEDMLLKHRASKARTAGKSVTGRKRKPAAAATDRKTDGPAPKTDAASKDPAGSARGGGAGKADAQGRPAAKPAARTTTRKR